MYVIHFATDFLWSLFYCFFPYNYTKKKKKKKLNVLLFRQIYNVHQAFLQETLLEQTDRLGQSDFPSTYLILRIRFCPFSVFVFLLALICTFQPTFFLYKLILLANFSFYLFHTFITIFFQTRNLQKNLEPNLHQLQLMRFQLSFFLDHVLMPSWSFSKQECVFVFSFSFHELKKWHSFFLGCRCLTITSKQHTSPKFVLALENKSSQFPPPSIFYHHIR